MFLTYAIKFMEKKYKITIVDNYWTYRKEKAFFGKLYQTMEKLIIMPIWINFIKIFNRIFNSQKDVSLIFCIKIFKITGTFFYIGRIFCNAFLLPKMGKLENSFLNSLLRKFSTKKTKILIYCNITHLILTNNLYLIVYQVFIKPRFFQTKNHEKFSYSSRSKCTYVSPMNGSGF
jgi:hypothetical protein